jgi:DNA-binding GntR family transcriptional regulator
MKSPISTIEQPKYLHIAQTLFNEIQAGIYEVGSLLPTEQQLCKQFGISRFTAREALKRLTHLGVVTRRARIGTTVVARNPQSLYQQNLGTVNDIYQYASETSLKIIHKRPAEIDADTARLLEATRGEVWLHLEGYRYVPGNTIPIACTEIWISPAFRSVKGLSGSLHRAVHAFIEEQFGVSITTVEQTIDAVHLDSASAGALLVEEGAPGLQIERRYRSRNGDLVQYASSVHAAGHFSYRSVFHREWKADVGAGK